MRLMHIAFYYVSCIVHLVPKFEKKTAKANSQLPTNENGGAMSRHPFCTD